MNKSSKPVTLSQNTDFRRLYKRGRSDVNPALVSYYMKNHAGICRIGVTSSKKIGNAVERNKSRRLIRAAFQNLYKQYSIYLQGYDFVFVARVKTRYKKSYDIENIMLKQLQSAGIIPR